MSETITEPDEPDDSPATVDDVGDQICKLLTGHDPGWQSAVIADLAARWVAGHHPALRAEVFAMHIGLIRELIPLAELQQFGTDGHPGWADMPPGAKDAT